MDDDVYEGDSFEGVAWYCDSCGTLLNRQYGFSDSYGSWTCTDCGHNNRTTEDDIISENIPRFRCPKCGAGLDNQWYFSDYLYDWSCTECGARLHREYSFDEFDEVVTDDNSGNSNNYVDDNEDVNSDSSDYFYSTAYSSPKSTCVDSYSSNASEYSRSPQSSYEDTHIPIQKRRNWKLRILCVLLLVVATLIVGVYYEIRLLTPVGRASSAMIGKKYETVVKSMEHAGFTNIRVDEIADLPLSRISEDNKVVSVKIGGIEEFRAVAKFPSNFPVVITYHSIEKYPLPISSKDSKGSNYQDIMKVFKEAGFNRISFEVEYDIITGWITDDGEVKAVSVNGDNWFFAGDDYRADAEIVITYHTYRKNKPK